MHVRPGLCTGPRWGSLQHYSKPPSSIKGPTSKGEGRWRGGKEKGEVERGGRVLDEEIG